MLSIAIEEFLPQHATCMSCDLAAVLVGMMLQTLLTTQQYLSIMRHNVAIEKSAQTYL